MTVNRAPDDVQPDELPAPQHKVGDRVVVCSFVGCGWCWYCANDLWCLCDNSDTNPGIGQALFGYETGAVFGYSHAMGGLRGSHAEYVRVPFADYGAFTVPDGVDDTSALFGAERVISIDRIPERLAITEQHIGSEVIDYTATDVGAELRERTGGRGPDIYWGP